MMLQINVKPGERYERVSGTARKTFLAGLGFLAMAQEELQGMGKRGNELATTFVERGERMTNGRREQLADVVVQPERRARQLGERAQSTWNGYVNGFLGRLNLPTDEDVKALSAQVEALDRQVSALGKK